MSKSLVNTYQTLRVSIMMYNRKQQTLITPLLITVFVVVVLVLAYRYLLSATDSKSQAVVLIASSLAAICSIWNIVSSYQTSVQIEELKQRLNVKLPALQETVDASHQYYRSLCRLETNRFDLQRIVDSDEAMEKADSKIVFFSSKYQDAWYNYWQKARFIFENIEEGSLQDAQENWQKSWKKDLAIHLKALTDAQAQESI